VTVAGISGVHALYLARGGHDFLIGDGRLQYGPKTISESYYNARVLPWLFAAIDLQHVTNPAYSQDRGLVWIPSLRLPLGQSRDGRLRGQVIFLMNLDDVDPGPILRGRPGFFTLVRCRHV
jgi:hypothetical protein